MLFKISPPPTPVPTVTIRKSEKSLPAPKICSPIAAHVASLSAITGRLNLSFKKLTKGAFIKPGIFSQLYKIPVFLFTNPGVPIPIPFILIPFFNHFSTGFAYSSIISFQSGVFSV